MPLMMTATAVQCCTLTAPFYLGAFNIVLHIWPSIHMKAWAWQTHHFCVQVQSILICACECVEEMTVVIVGAFSCNRGVREQPCVDASYMRFNLLTTAAGMSLNQSWHQRLPRGLMNKVGVLLLCPHMTWRVIFVLLWIPRILICGTVWRAALTTFTRC